MAVPMETDNYDTSQPMDVDVISSRIKQNMSFHNFPPVWNIITMPPGMIVYRASNTDPTSTSDPRFFSDYQVADQYRKKYQSKLFTCELMPGTRLCDIRTLRYLVLEIMLNLQMSGQVIDQSTRNGMKSFMHAFGLFSHTKQVEFINTKYENDKRTSPYNTKDYRNKEEPFHNIGSRISYGVVDDEAVFFLKALLGEMIDGYISPVLQTPWHGKKGFNPEICLFTPNNSLKKPATPIPIDQKSSITQNIDFTSILQSAGYKYVSNTVQNTGITGTTSGGKKTHLRGGAGGNKPRLRTSGGAPQLEVFIRDRGNGTSGDEPSFSPTPFSLPPLPISLGVVARTHDISDNWKVRTNDILEKLIEQSFKIQCELSKNQHLKKFMGELLKKMTNLLYETFKIVTEKEKPKPTDADLIRTIKYHYQPQKHVDAGTVYVLKPGINMDNNVVDMIVTALAGARVEAKAASEGAASGLALAEANAENAIQDLKLAEIMGAQYGILTHAGMFTLMFQATIKYKGTSLDKQTEYPNIARLKVSYEQVVRAIGDLFGVKGFDLERMSRILDNDDLVFKTTWDTIKGEKIVYGVKKGNMRNIIMDMMVNNPTTAGNVSIVRKNLNNQEYIRSRVQKSVKDKPDYKIKRKQPECPIFYTTSPSQSQSTVMMVEGDEWYAVTANGFFRHLMDSESRIWKAGPSGSTFMWMNMVFSLLGIPHDEHNYKLLLLCIIADFVPMYHSLPEVLLVYSMENPYTNGSLGTPNLYTLDQNPIQWLLNHMGAPPAPDRQRGGVEPEKPTEPTFRKVILPPLNSPPQPPLTPQEAAKNLEITLTLDTEQDFEGDLIKILEEIIPTLKPKYNS